MGAGNFLPPSGDTYPRNCEMPGIDPVYEMVYVCANYEVEDLDPDTIQDNQNNFEVELQDHVNRLLPRSFERREELSFENQVLAVYLYSQYEGIYYPLIVTPRHPLGIRHMETVSRRLFDGLTALGYSLRVRAGAWCSGEYVPSNIANRKAVSSAGNYFPVR